jgi:hypothetical protein
MSGSSPSSMPPSSESTPSKVNPTKDSELVAIKVSNDLYADGQSISQNVIDVKKYNPIIDAAVETSIENGIVG